MFLWQAGTQFWDEKLENELAEGRLSSASFDRYIYKADDMKQWLEDFAWNSHTDLVMHLVVGSTIRSWLDNGRLWGYIPLL